MTSYTAAIRADSDLISAALRTGDHGATVAACPGWDLSRLVIHLGKVHRWATSALLLGAAPPAGTEFGPDDDADLTVWIVDGAARLIDAIEQSDPTTDTWHPFPFEQKAWVWARRQAMETAMHRWDAQDAIGASPSLDPVQASEGIKEYLEMLLPRVIEQRHVTPPPSSLHIHCTDVDGEWLVWADAGTYRMLPIHDRGDAAIRGPAADIWLLLMGRIDRSRLDIVGDTAAADAWLDLFGL